MTITLCNELCYFSDEQLLCLLNHDSKSIISEFYEIE